MASKAISDALFASMRSVLADALALSDWLKAVSKELYRNNKQFVFRSGSGLLVESKYCKLDKIAVKIRFTGKQKSFTLGIDSDKVDGQRSARAINANFIQSYDAAHLAAVVASVSFDVVTAHDSFSVSPCNVVRLMPVLKNKFVILHEKTTIESICKQLRDGLGVDIKPPKTGNLNLKEVLDAEYFFA